ncbi:M56 family metallopeptidase [Streptomyces pseudovenezuelae]|uniref:Zn-dependent protease with chaperone function n=1 Tax=Streptomyces pseudovenezuelae TaxID=67350 RepID=A0ABT6LPK4_9ACTN|nr:M56 family metallopeptidase [Streptomyces pseudovenezuelae]MDH6218229.1 Zn-dependent protease with chaperone function [Streptomyces pseudovenezuelae]
MTPAPLLIPLLQVPLLQVLLLLVPLLLPFAAPPLARRILDRCPPVAALWSLTASALLLAGGTVAALGTLALTGLLKIPAFAALGELTHPLRTPSARLILPLAALAAGLLTLGALTLGRSVLRQVTGFRAARSEADRRPAAGDLCVVDSPHPDAYALPGRPQRIVVTTGMLRSLDAAEREALFAHERAHNAGRHHYFLAAAELTAHCHPALRPVRAAIRLAAERAADEVAARTVGDRRLTARAIARAALASTAPPPHSSVTPGVATGPVPHRVTALLSPVPLRPRTWIAALLTTCALLSSATAATVALQVHENIEIAQGETTD